MKLGYVITLAATALTAVSAAAVPRQDTTGLTKYLVIFEKGLATPDRVIRMAERKLKELGATITYEYNTVIKGFAVTAPAVAISSFETEQVDPEFPYIVEVDKEVSTAG